MDYSIRKWDKEAKKDMILFIIDSTNGLSRVETSIKNIKDENQGEVVELVSYFKSGSIQGMGFYNISKEDVDRWIKKVYETKGKVILDQFSKLF